jgi:Tfp pilus assembly protein PilV
MKNLLTLHARRGGMVIMEVLCALLIFGMAVVGLMKALTISARSASISQQELRMILRLQSRLNETSKYPKIDELYNTEPVKTTDPDDLGVWTRTEIIKIEDVTNSEGQPLNDMYHIVVTAFYDDFGRTGQLSADTVRYAKLYNTTTTAGAGAAIPQQTR